MKSGVGIVTKQNATKDVPGGEYMNVKKLHLGKGAKETSKSKWFQTNVLFNLVSKKSKRI